MNFVVNNVELDNQIQEYGFGEDDVDFSIEGESNNIKYNLKIRLLISHRELSNINQYEIIDVGNIVDSSNIELYVNDERNSSFVGDYKLNRYIDTEFTLNINIKNNDYTIQAEIPFSI